MTIRSLLITGGLILFVLGMLFLAQGRGWLPWPAGGLMVGNPEWVLNGAIIAVVGLLMVLVGRRLRR